MGYVVTIRRPDGGRIEAEAFQAAIADDPTFDVEPRASTGDVIAFWKADGDKRTAFSYSAVAGTIDVTTPSNATLQRMQELARVLDARVFGEEGEELTEVAVPDREVQARGCGIVTVLVTAIVVALYWWIR